MAISLMCKAVIMAARQPSTDLNWLPGIPTGHQMAARHPNGTSNGCQHLKGISNDRIECRSCINCGRARNLRDGREKRLWAQVTFSELLPGVCKCQSSGCTDSLCYVVCLASRLYIAVLQPVTHLKEFTCCSKFGLCSLNAHMIAVGWTGKGVEGSRIWPQQ